MSTLQYSEKDPSNDHYEVVADGVLKVENVRSSVLAKQLLKIESSQYITTQVQQRLLGALKKNPQLAKKLNLEKIVYVLGNAEGSEDFGSYYLDLKIFAEKKASA